jgi:hypothetical protein
MADHLKVPVYVPAADARRLRARGKDPAAWVRMLVRRALEQEGARNA